MIDVKALILCCPVTCVSSAIEQKKQAPKTSSLTQTDIILHERKTEVKNDSFVFRSTPKEKMDSQLSFSLLGPGSEVPCLLTWLTSKGIIFPGNFANDHLSTMPIFFVFPVPLGSSPLLAAISCNEIKASEGEAVSGKYWLSGLKANVMVCAFCDMKTGGR